MIESLVIGVKLPDRVAGNRGVKLPDRVAGNRG